MSRTVLVGLGGFIGSIARYWIWGLVQSLAGPTFPFGTLVVNIVGGFVLGAVLVLSLERALFGPDLRLFLAAGVCGGFTTMSAFSYETVELIRDGELLASAWNVVLTVFACCAAVWLGGVTARVL